MNELLNVHTVVEEKEKDLVAPEEFLEWKASEKEIEPEIELSEEMQKTFVELAKKILKNSAKNYKELGGGSRVGEFKVELKENRIVNKYPYKRSAEEKRAIEKMCDELYEANLIELSDSPYNSPMFAIRKPDGTYRPIIDYRE